MKKYTTPQEEFWAGAFGDAYIERNADEKLLALKTGLFAKILSCIPGGGHSFVHRVWLEHRLEPHRFAAAHPKT